MVHVFAHGNPFVPILMGCPAIGETINYNEVYQYLMGLSKSKSFKAVSLSLFTNSVTGLEGYEVAHCNYRGQLGYLVVVSLWDLIHEFSTVCITKPECQNLLEVKREIWRVSPHMASLLLMNCQMTQLCTHQLYEGGRECGRYGNTAQWAEYDLDYGLELAQPHSFTEMDPRDRALIVAACKVLTTAKV